MAPRRCLLLALLVVLANAKLSLGQQSGFEVVESNPGEEESLISVVLNDNVWLEEREELSRTYMRKVHFHTYRVP